jgi:uncharacterized protein (TIGR02466 family)
MKLDHWFPSVVGREDHPEWVEPMTELVDQIFTSKDKNVNPNFYANGETTYGTRNLHDESEFLPFLEFVKHKGAEFLEQQGFDSGKVPWKPFLFANSFLQGSAHPKHLHSQCTLSGIFYLRTPPGSSNIVFYPNQPFKDFFDYMFHQKDPTNWYGQQKTEYRPYPGLLLLWPAWLYHEVPPNNSNEPRTSLVFNL